MAFAVEPLGRDDYSAAAGVLARAFRDNPGILAVLRDDAPEQRLRLMEPSMRGFVAGVARHGAAEVVKDGAAVVAVSLSFPPGGFPPPLWFQITTAKGPLMAGLGRALRFLDVDTEMKKRHPRYPHWYLWFLGVEPERQGQGLGSILLRALSDRADAANVPAYLETDKQTSVRLYEKHGYVVQTEEVISKAALRLWFMKRSERAK